jgi:hypothetical protein
VEMDESDDELVDYGPSLHKDQAFKARSDFYNGDFLYWSRDCQRFHTRQGVMDSRNASFMKPHKLIQLLMWNLYRKKGLMRLNYTLFIHRRTLKPPFWCP